MNRFTVIAISLATGLTVSSAAVAAPAQDAIRACKVAVEESVGDGVLSNLTKVKSRGGNYEVWLNVKGDDLQQRSYCYLRRGEVQQLVMEEGKWVGRNPRRPEAAEVG
ncbi:MAG: hypothetical protein ACR2QB_06740 [Gammaproteobacteria bacterium]